MTSEITNMKMNLEQLASRLNSGLIHKNTNVKLNLRSVRGTATLVLSAQKALKPNASRRYFPPIEPALLGWPEPYFYMEECESVELN